MALMNKFEIFISFCIAKCKA